MTPSDRPPDSASDIRYEAFIIRAAPAFARPYLRLIRADRPIGTWLLLIPCWWSLAIAGQALGPIGPDPWFMAYMAIGAFVMRGAGCVVNDLWDRKIDAQVARTADRPIASGEISVRAALVFLAGILLCGLAILLQFNWFTICLGISSLLLVATYPLMKRITYWPQAFLGLTFNWGALMGVAAMQETLTLPALLLYGGCIFWTLGYDTVYGHQDKSDDIMVGVKSSSIKLGTKTKPFVAVSYACALTLFIAAAVLVEMTWPFFVAAAGMAVHFGWQIKTLDIDAPRNCLVRFKSNRDAGLILFIGLLLG